MQGLRLLHHYKVIMSNYMKNVFYVLGGVMMFDFLGFIMWAMSGQVAPDSYHIGIISESIIKAII